MANDSPTQTHYTRQVHQLIDRIYGRSSQKDSVLDRAICFFEHDEFRPSNEVLSENEKELLRLEQTDRHSNLLKICLDILELAEGDTFEETNRRSAQFLGTIQLISPTEGKKVALNNETCKALYKAILCLRLLDRLVLDNKIQERNILTFTEGLTSTEYCALAKSDPEKYQEFVHQVKVPIIMAALLQDIGNYHPKSQEILCGKEGKENPFRVLDVEQRKELLQINYRETLKYFIQGLGTPIFVGNTKAERDKFLIDEQEKSDFIKKLLKTSVNPKNSIGNLLKVPQIYTSIIMSTKDSYNYKLLPQVFQVLNKNAEIGACSKTVVDALYQITGMFPQGYGIVYMPIDDFGEQGDCYEYGIVNSFYPKHPEHPICRMATRKLSFIGYGQNITVSKQSNLYFTQTAKKLAKLSKERLHEILELLTSNFQERKELDLLPRCWHANEFFSVKANQKLWNKVEKSL